MNRKQFIQSHGASCRNWTWSWSFVNHERHFVIFGAWDQLAEGRKELILTEDWQINRRGRKNTGYNQSREHIRLVEESGYKLFTFPMAYSAEMEGEDGFGPARIGDFTPVLTEKKLMRIGASWYAGTEEQPITLAEEVPQQGNFFEGAKISVTINAYERNSKAREACITRRGLSCLVCDFNFGDKFGELGRGFIHVHHVVPLSSIGKEYKIDPITDLAPVCPNCHAMLHKVEPPLTVEQLRELLNSSMRDTKSEIPAGNAKPIDDFLATSKAV
jgi:5-methylcytosine-specific restriction protein A